MNPGTIYLIPSPISDANREFFIPEGIKDLIYGLNIFFVENVRTTRRYFSSLGIKNIDSIRFELLNKNTTAQEISSYTDLVKNGLQAGILSEAGCPGIADPGSQLIKNAHLHNIRVIPLTGPSSIFLALMASGFNGQNFVFHGYLPIENSSRNNKLLELEKMAVRNDQTQIFMETPYRNNKMLTSILKTLNNETLLCVAADISGQEELIKTHKIKTWRGLKIDLHKKPAIFLIFHA